MIIDKTKIEKFWEWCKKQGIEICFYKDYYKVEFKGGENEN
jgi:hypothetical protein